MSDSDPPHREQRVIDTFVELADTLATTFDIGELLHYLVHQCAMILQADTAGVLVESPGGSLQLTAATSEEMGVIERAELESGHGPCVEAYRLGEQVVVDHLADFSDRWPDVVARLAEMGLHGGCAFPIRLRDDRIGALNLYRSQPGPFREDDLRVAQAFADVAAIGILQERAIGAARTRADQLEHALATRIVIEQAKGVISQRYGVSPVEAFNVIRRYARNHRVTVRSVGQEIIDGVLKDIDFPD